MDRMRVCCGAVRLGAESGDHAPGGSRGRGMVGGAAGLLEPSPRGRSGSKVLSMGGFWACLVRQQLRRHA